MHLLAGMALGLPELALSDDEARDLADAVQIVSKEYGVKISGKTAAGLNLLMTAVVIYAPKFLAVLMRAKQSGGDKVSGSAMPSATASAATKEFKGIDLSAPIARPDWVKG